MICSRKIYMLDLQWDLERLEKVNRGEQVPIV